MNMIFSRLYGQRVIIGALFISAIFLTATIMNLQYVNAELDETSHAYFSVSFLKGCPMDSWSDHHVSIFNKKFILDFQGGNGYSFGLACYLLLPFIKIFGASIYALKLMPIILTWLFVLLAGYAIREYFNAMTAFLAMALLVTNPLFIHYSRIGLFITEPVLNFFFAAALSFFLVYLKKRKMIYLCIAALLFGCGFSVKLSMASRFLGLSAAVLAVYGKKVRLFIASLGVKNIIIVAASFCLGASLMILTNVANKGKTFQLLNYFYTDRMTPDGGSNRRLMSNLQQRLEHFENTMLDEEDKEVYCNLISNPPAEKRTAKIIFLTALAGNLVLGAVSGTGITGRIIFTYLLYALMFISTLFSPGSWRPLHMAIMYPFPQLVVALFIFQIYASLGTHFKAGLVRNSLKCALVLAAAALIILKANNVIAYQNKYHEYGKRKYGEDHSVRMLGEYFRKKAIPESSLCVLNPDLAGKYNLLNCGGLTNGHVIGTMNQGEFVAEAEARRIIFNSNNEIFIVVQENEPCPCCSENVNSKIKWVLKNAGRKGKRIFLYDELRNKDNSPLFSIYRMN